MSCMNGELKKVCLYSRVSTNGQTTENQLVELKSLCERNNWEIVEVYDETISGTKNNDDRPEFKRMMKDLKRREFSMVVTYSLDRLGRKTSELINFLSLCEDYGINLFCWKQNINTEDSMGKMFFQFISIISSYENEIRKERQLSGINRLRREGKSYGGNKFISDEQKDKVLKLKQDGLSYRKIKDEVNISLSSISSICRGTI